MYCLVFEHDFEPHYFYGLDRAFMRASGEWRSKSGGKPIEWVQKDDSYLIDGFCSIYRLQFEDEDTIISIIQDVK